MSEELHSDLIASIFGGKPAKIEEFFSKWNFANAAVSKFDMANSAKNELGDRICEVIENGELTHVLLETIKILSREKDGLEGLLNDPLCDKILAFAELSSNENNSKTVHTLMEAQKCLINTLFHSQRMRDRFYANPKTGENLQFFLGEFEENRRKTSSIDWIRLLNPVQAAEIWYFYHRIAFIATALGREFQKNWANDPKTIDSLLLAVEICTNRSENSTQDINRATEALKTFFNVFCHFHGDVKAIDHKNAAKTCQILRDAICSDVLTDDVVQSAIHCLSVPPLPMVLSVLCGKNSKNNGGENEEEKFFVEELSNMQLTEAILMHLDKQLTKVVALLLNDAPNQQQNPMLSAEASTLTDLVGPYFQVLARLCTDSKYVRRYCRIRVIPPLVSEEVQKRPEENNTLRGRIARIMMLPSSTKDVAAEFLFIICKRSVNRMIKYLGFGHSAGHLANLGLLGQINQPKHASDSEDSETEDYNQIKDSVNPVTGAIYPSDHGSALAGMSEEQKEYEAMKLVDAMNQMMETGIVKPGTIGDDGKIREVSHVLELLKNAPEPAPAENSDSDEE